MVPEWILRFFNPVLSLEVLLFTHRSLDKAKGIIEFAEAAESILQSYEGVGVSFKIAGWTETGGG